MEAYKIEHLNKSYADKVIFDDLSLAISNHEKIGLVGINGTGKSTLLKVMGGIDDDFTGDITHPNQYRIRYSSQKQDLDGNLSVFEAVLSSETSTLQIIKHYEQAVQQYTVEQTDRNFQAMMAAQEAMDRHEAWDYNAEIKTILSKLGIHDTTKQVSSLSGGQQKRVVLAKTLIEQPDLLLLDEPTNHLDFESINWLINYVKQYPYTVLFVTHDRYFLNEVSTRIVELDRGKLTTYPGNYEDYIAMRAEKEVIEQKQNDKQRALYKQELAWMRAGAKARSTKQQARIHRFNDLEADVKQQQTQDKGELNLAYSRLGKQVYELDSLTKIINGRTLFQDITQIIQSGQRIGIVGPNGAGKTTMLNILSGEDQQFEGTLKIGQTVKVAYFKQTEETLNRDIRMIDYLREESEVAKEKDGTTVSITQLLERFLFPSSTHGKKIYKLSGGEQKRLYLLRLLVHQPNVLLLDEPTNDLDTETLTILEDYIASFGGSVITVSHDRYFLNKVAQEYWFIHDGMMERIVGSFEDYETYKKEKDKQLAIEKQATNTSKTQIKERKKTGLSYKEKREYESLMSRIEETEIRLSEIEQEMIEASADYAKIKDLTIEQQQLEQTYDEDITRWSELEELKEV
ncbi:MULTISPECIES: ABC-F family ATP-binding cassette domain-containing protein [Staphylococcus]|jgi:ATP-binding cassette subfamily F protein uup|uniref:ABC-F family ATP-binding cassette domain-containing protein n=1 Tax=Staphylococcus lugdunensis TaxID=28035 RepID=A0ABX6BY19_STALU|nr:MULTISPECIES: ABC-F family ATP-binding cassette domain-containing protein [Staphylococcus]ADC88201.1 duplicated ATPase domains-containing ABC transporters [Staphylococcus lugdunensis HKU09-01]AMG64809.1 ABC transporter ATP-binding protein [Staphylococcus lugdunensis]ARB78400.1 ABC transporter ATP-binding protein [Staphylococcus lugdunensis]ARJ09931.1 heme ABC transporter ATP-binding protein [Staphylococcus lugdunensis]ARJ16973.1 heme ABC transporter ATP-binding protein [Staphylococcus lugdu